MGASAAPTDLITAGYQLAASCHQRMLACENTDRREGAAHALAGFELITQLRSTGLPLPDWLEPQEEQFCRYGAIWIHEILGTANQREPELCADGVRLLERLEQIHAGAFPWISDLLRELRNRGSSTATPDPGDMRVVVVGNCQAFPLALALQRALPTLRIHQCPSVHLATAEDVRRLHQRLSSTELLVMHRVMPGYRNNIGLDSTTLRQLLPAAARCLILPNLHYEGHHPWIGYAHDPEGRLAELDSESPLGPYHDFLAMAAARDGIPLDRLLDPACAPSILESLREQHHLSLKELERREADCDLPLSDWIALHHQDIPLAHTINHPTQAVLNELLRRLLKLLNLPSSIDASTQDNTEHLGALSIPIHPWVRQALELNPWSQCWGQRQEITWPIEQQLQQSLDFYQRHPWIANANSQHPKLHLAEELLQQLLIRANHTAQRKAPSIAALINYFNDEDMLSWQLKAGCLDHYDRIYIWDGPYGYLHRLPLFPDEAKRLDSTPLGQQLLADPRVIYRHRHWRDEAEKRIDAYASIEEDVIVIHDTDEFFKVDPDLFRRFWDSDHAVGGQRIQNLYAGGLLGSHSQNPAYRLEDLPLRRGLFRRSAIAPERHLDYCWLVGVDQKPADDSLIHPQPLGHIFHLTACRTAAGQAAKMAFYMSLALSKGGIHPVVTRLSTLVEEGAISLSEAQAVFLRGDPGYAGVPNPAFGLQLSRRFEESSFPAKVLDAMFAEANVVADGYYQVLSHYPLNLWIPAEDHEQSLHLELDQPLPLHLRSWLWREGQTALSDQDIRCQTGALTLGLNAAPDHLGRLITLTIAASEPIPQLHTLQVRRQG